MSSSSGTHRSLILRNILWANLNTGLRYALAFVATSFLARNYSPDIFGTYQLVISYLAIFEAFFFINPTHLKNYLATYPDKESTVTSLWFWQNLVIFILIFCICGVGLATADDHVFWILLSIVSIRLAFRYNDYVSIICEQRFLNHLAQQVAIVQSVSFNIARIIFSMLRTNVFLLCLTSPIQGFAGIYQQYKIAKRLDIKPEYEIDKHEVLSIFKDGFFLAVLSFLGIFQSRIVSIVLAECLSMSDFGNFQLVIKLVEPATMLGMIILGTNYSVLANSLQGDKNVFNKRFFKISLLTMGLAIVLAGVIYLTPINLLIRFFGEQYVTGLALLGIGSLSVISNTLFLIDQNYDFLNKNYKLSLFKYILMLALYVGSVLYLKDRLTIVEGLWIFILVPLIISGISLFFRVIAALRESV